MKRFFITILTFSFLLVSLEAISAQEDTNIILEKPDKEVEALMDIYPSTLKIINNYCGTFSLGLEISDEDFCFDVTTEGLIVNSEGGVVFTIGATAKTEAQQLFYLATFSNLSSEIAEIYQSTTDASPIDTLEEDEIEKRFLDIAYWLSTQDFEIDNIERAFYADINDLEFTATRDDKGEIIPEPGMYSAVEVSQLNADASGEDTDLVYVEFSSLLGLPSLEPLPIDAGDAVYTYGVDSIFDPTALEIQAGLDGDVQLVEGFEPFAVDFVFTNDGFYGLIDHRPTIREGEMTIDSIIIPNSIIVEGLQANDIEVETNRILNAWQSAIESLWEGDYNSAKEGLDSLAILSDDPIISEYMSFIDSNLEEPNIAQREEAETVDTNEESALPFSPFILVFLLIAVSLLALILLIIVRIIKRLRKNKANKKDFPVPPMPEYKGTQNQPVIKKLGKEKPEDKNPIGDNTANTSPVRDNMDRRASIQQTQEGESVTNTASIPTNSKVSTNMTNQNKNQESPAGVPQQAQVVQKSNFNANTHDSSELQNNTERPSFTQATASQPLESPTPSPIDQQNPPQANFNNNQAQTNKTMSVDQTEIYNSAPKKTQKPIQNITQQNQKESPLPNESIHKDSLQQANENSQNRSDVNTQNINKNSTDTQNQQANPRQTHEVPSQNTSSPREENHQNPQNKQTKEEELPEWLRPVE